jgi:hypothetical protein
MHGNRSLNCIIMWDFRFSRRRVWRWLSSRMLRLVVWQKFTDVSLWWRQQAPLNVDKLLPDYTTQHPRRVGVAISSQNALLAWKAEKEKEFFTPFFPFFPKQRWERDNERKEGRRKGYKYALTPSRHVSIGNYTFWLRHTRAETKLFSVARAWRMIKINGEHGRTFNVRSKNAIKIPVSLWSTNWSQNRPSDSGDVHRRFERLKL